MSSKIPTRVSASLGEFARHGCGSGPHCDGWGVAFYDGMDAQVFREPEPAATSEWMRFLLEHQRRSACVLSHVRLATTGAVALRNTQPFSRVLGGRRHVFCHNGDLPHLPADCQSLHIRPIGETDSERVFCCLLEKLDVLWQQGRPALDRRLAVIEPLFMRLSALGGQANFLYSDGDYLYAFANKRRQQSGRVEPPGLYYLERHCETDPDALTDATTAQTGAEQRVICFASVALTPEAWVALEPDQLIVARHGRIVWRNVGP
jgi:glutamine amidotransferase